MLFLGGGEKQTTLIRPHSHLSSIIITGMPFTFNYFRELMQYTQRNIPRYPCTWKFCGMQASRMGISCTGHTQQRPRHTGLHLFPQRDRRKCHPLDGIPQWNLLETTIKNTASHCFLRGSIAWLNLPFSLFSHTTSTQKAKHGGSSPDM